MNHDLPTTKKTFAGPSKSDTISRHGDNSFDFAISSMRGRRQNQEDTFIIETELRPFNSKQYNALPGHSLFAVFDGHGTSFASDYASKHFLSTFCMQKSFIEYHDRYLNDSKKFNNSVKPKKCKGMNKVSRKSSIEPSSSSDEFLVLLDDAIKKTILELDAGLLQEINTRKTHNVNSNSTSDSDTNFDESDAGTTAIIVALTPTYIFCANLGDSRAILQQCRNDTNNTTGGAICLSTDHKPINTGEEARIRKAGGIVLGGKIEARLAVSRALGDFAFKHTPSVLYSAILSQDEDSPMIDDYVHPEDQMVSSVPEITSLPRDDASYQFLIIGSDGIWDVLSNEKCADLISTIFNEGEQSVALVCEELLDQCYAKGSLDNMTAILIKFASQKIGHGGGVMKRRIGRKSNQNKDSSMIDDYVHPEDHMISSVPENVSLPRDDARHQFLIIGRDEEKCVILECEELLDKCYAKGSLDNMTAILIKFVSQKIGHGGGVMKRRIGGKRK
ncbi:hypothetical protein ACHAW6_014647 [Cyclotella cf. meneghiniana]